MALPSGVEHIIKKNINGNVTYIFPYSKTSLIWDTARQVYLNQILNDIYINKQNTLIAGENISIIDNVISSTGGITSVNWEDIQGNPNDNTALVNYISQQIGSLQLEHKSYYDTYTYTLYEGIAPNGSTTSQAVWTITTIVSNAIGTIVSTTTETNQTWNYN